MLKKLTGIFILLCFLLMKSTPLFAITELKVNITASSTGQQAADDPSDAEKEPKQLETTDEDFMQACIGVPGFVTLSSPVVIFNAGRICTPYLSLPYPPPNGR